MRWLGWLDARFYAPLGPERLATLRVLVGSYAVVYLAIRAPVLASFRGFDASQFRPVGLAAWLTAPLPDGVVLAIYLAAIGFGVAFVLGARFRLSGPAFALLALWVTSYRNSWGMIFHTDNLWVVHLAVLACSDAAAALSLDAQRTAAPEHSRPTAGATAPISIGRGRFAAAPEHSRPTAGATAPISIGRGRFAAAPVTIARGRFGWPVRLLCAVTVTTYVLAGIAKLKASGWSWIEGEILRNYIAYDAVRKAQVGSIHSPFGAWLVQMAWPFPIIGALTLSIELGGPLALLNQSAARLWVFGAYAFHVGVLATMAIAFPYPLCGVAFASFFACEKLWQFRGLAPIARRLGGVPAARSAAADPAARGSRG